MSGNPFIDPATGRFVGTRSNDLFGREFGRLTVLGRTTCPEGKSGKRHSWWDCRCECGTTLPLPARSLVHRNSKSCGCIRRENEYLTGATFHRLTVTGRASCPEHIINPTYQGRAWWACKCECGAERVANGPDLRSGKTKSCGCLAREQKSKAMLAIRERQRAATGRPSPAERKLISEEKQRRRRQMLRDQKRAAAALVPKVPRIRVARNTCPNSQWTEEREQELRVLWERGISTPQIGAILGVSKNAVVGKAHRLLLDPRPSPIKYHGDRSTPLRPIPPVPRLVRTLPPLPSELIAKPAPPRPPPAPRPVVVRPVLVAEPVRLDRSRTCQFLSGERRKMVACGEHVVAGSVYCPEHHKLCFVPRRREQAA